MTTPRLLRQLSCRRPRGGGWSEQDRRTLIITIVGGLAANLATVILVGGALAWVRVGKTSGAADSKLLVEALGYMAFCLVMIPFGTPVRFHGSAGLWSGWAGWVNWWE